MGRWLIEPDGQRSVAQREPLGEMPSKCILPLMSAHKTHASRVDDMWLLDGSP